MAGHSHWAKIKRAKGATDAKRGKLFSRLSREITVAAKLGGGDPGFNPRLRQAISAAKAESVPADNIERAIKKGTGELAGESYEEIVYEGYGPGGVAMLVETTTDNKNRTAAEIRSIFSKGGGSMGGAGSVAWMFARKGLVTVDAAKASEDDILGAALDAGLEDVRPGEGVLEAVTPPEKLDAVRVALEGAGFAPTAAKFTYFPANLTPVTEAATAEQILKLCETLDDQDDVQNVYTNFDIPAEVMAQLSAA